MKQFPQVHIFKMLHKFKRWPKARFLPAQIDKTSSIKGKLIDVSCGKWRCPPLSPPTIHLDFSTLYFKPLHSKIYAQHNKKPKLPSSPKKINYKSNTSTYIFLFWCPLKKDVLSFKNLTITTYGFLTFFFKQKCLIALTWRNQKIWQKLGKSHWCPPWHGTQD